MRIVYKIRQWKKGEGMASMELGDAAQQKLIEIVRDGVLDGMKKANIDVMTIGISLSVDLGVCDMQPRKNTACPADVASTAIKASAKDGGR